MAIRKKFADYFEGFRQEHAGACDEAKGVHCAMMRAVIAIFVDGNTPVGFEVAPMWNVSTGAQRSALVYHARRSDYITLNYCPFCGQPVNVQKAPKKSARKKAVKRGHNAK